MGDTYWVQRRLTPTPLAGTSVTIDATAPAGDRYNLFIAEIRPFNGADTTAPAASLTAPSDGATVSGTAVTVSAAASDNVGVAGVQFKLDGVDLGVEDVSSPYTIAWDTTTVVNGSHSLTAVARDARRQHDEFRRRERDGRESGHDRLECTRQHRLRDGVERDAVERDGERAGDVRLHAGGRDAC